MGRTATSNPFRPGAGAVPHVWIGRRESLDEHDLVRTARLHGSYTPGTVFIGPSGIGKSVLVNRFAKRDDQVGDVVLDAVRVAKRSDPIAHLASAVHDAGGQVASGRRHGPLGDLLDRVELIAVKGVQFASKDSAANPHLTVRDALVHLGGVLAHENVGRRHPRMLVVRIDELQNADDTQRSALLTALGDLLEHTVEIQPGPGMPVKHYLPVLVYVTGLPELLNRATNVDTFRRRFATKKLSQFSDTQILDTLAKVALPSGVTVAPEAARAIAALVGGDPYLFQFVGHAAWNAGDGDRIEVGDVKAADDITYGERLRYVEAASEDVPEGEGEVLDAMYAVAGDHDVARGVDVAGQIGKNLPQIATAARRLEQRALIVRERRQWRVTNRLVRRLRESGDIV